MDWLAARGRWLKINAGEGRFTERGEDDQCRSDEGISKFKCFEFGRAGRDRSHCGYQKERVLSGVLSL